MEFSLFAHLERINEAQSQKALYDGFIELCKMADQAGFQAVWTGEHHGMNFTIAPNPLLSLVDLSHQTTQVRLGTGTVVAPFWHPIKLAGEIAMTDLITAGRLDVGIARGAYQFEYERLMPGMDAWEAGQRMREMIPAIKNLWQGDYAHDGEFYQFPATTSAPKPLQEGGPPIWLAARDPNSFEFAIANDCHLQVTPLMFGLEEIESLMTKFNEAKAKVGAGRNPKIMLLQHFYVAEDEQDAKQAAQEISRFFCHFGAWFKNERPISQGLIKPLTEAEMSEMTIYAPEVLAQNMPIGTAGQVIERLKQYQQLGYDEFSLWIDSTMSHERKQGSLERFINQVMPEFN